MLTAFLLALALDTTNVRAITLAPAETLHTVSIGSGETVVFIPGLLGGAFGYREVMQRLAERSVRAVAVEPLGYGESSRPSRADYSLGAQAARIGQVMDSLGIPSAWIVAHALGASIALRLAQAAPERVKGVLLLEGGVSESAAPPGLKRAMKLAPLLKLFVGRGTIRRSIRSGLRSNSGDTTWISDAVLDGYTAGAARNVGATINAFRGMARSHETATLHSLLAEIRIPVRLLLGTAPHESGVSAGAVDSLTQLLPDFEVEEVAGAGQYLHEERPDAVVQALVSLMEL